MESAVRRLAFLQTSLGSSLPSSSSSSCFVPSPTAYEHGSSVASEACANILLGSGKRDNDVVIVSALRTPITKAKRGGLKDTHPTDLLVAVLKATLERTKIDPAIVGDIVVGNVLCPGSGATQWRMAMFMAGFPESVPISSINRQCSSGLTAVANIAHAIASGVIDCGIAAGVESMSQTPRDPGVINQKIYENQAASDCMLPMGITSENVAEKFCIDRRSQDEFSVISQQRAARAQREGKFAAEIVPVKTQVQKENGTSVEVTVSKDDGIRESTLEELSKLKPAFKKNGSSTAGNSSQVSDGAAAVLLMARAKARQLGLKVKGVFRSFAVVGVPPSVMGIGPAFAIPAALQKASLTLDDISVVELNEAFASQALYCAQVLKIPSAKLNPNGGAIALGHPLGCTGARLVATLLNELHRRKGRHGIVSMCLGTGMGAAAVIEAEFD